MRREKYVRIENKDLEWWETRLRWGFFDVLEDRELPVIVVHENSTLVYNSGLNKSQVHALIRWMKKLAEWKENPS